MGKQTAAAGIKKYIKFAGNAVCGVSVLFLMIALMRTEFDFSQVTNWRLFQDSDSVYICKRMVFLAGIFCKKTL